ncbi:hypothetical protein [Natrinema halophilum]|uniref:Trypsin-like peptidase domain-containing protein n=1 Tax=Natrinema halophilum TaxID=1699371 RepID=A0A7D5GHW3_9EURY|nr:hypothetical protein [Natrinema halophilum]QLG49454.1 S1 family peptidase [Natrinema halophilum]
MAQIDTMEIPDSVREDLESTENVTGTAFGLKQTREEGITDREAIVVYVEEKRPEEELADEDILPKELDIDDETYKIDVQESGDVKMLEQAMRPSEPPMEMAEAEPELEAIPPSLSRKEKWRPAPAGVSVGHPDVTAGTLGTPPLRTTDGRTVFLTNSHVAADSGDASDGDDVYQPGTYDGGSSSDVIGTLVEFSEISTSGNNTTDSALVEVRPDHLQSDIFELGSDLRAFTDAEIGERHTKSGRTTSVTNGKCTARNATFNVGFKHGTARFVGLDVFEPIASGGDSGSLIGVERPDGFYGSSLLFAGSSSLTLGIPMDAVQQFHGRLEPMTGRELVDPDDMRITGTAFSMSLNAGQSAYRWSGPWHDRYSVDFDAIPETAGGWVSSSVESAYKTTSGVYYRVRIQNKRTNASVDCDVKYAVRR